MEEKKQTQEQTVQETAVDRNQLIVRTSIIGILANVFLAAFKAVVGLFSHSIAVTLDAVNNLSDALSSVITIAGTKLANKLPDKKHPYGHGRAEYLSAMIVAAIVLFAGLTSANESVKKIIHPVKADYSSVSLVIIASAVIVKIVLGQYVKRQGKKANSGALIASGADALFDAILSASVLASAVIYLTTGVSLEAYVGVVISLFIIKSGIEMMMDTVNDIIGRRYDPQETKKIKEILTMLPEVRGAYDLIINNYGPDKNLASVHLELPDTMTVDQVDALTRKVERQVYRETGVILTAVGVYSYNTTDEKAAQIRNEVQHIVMEHDWVLQMHGFYLEAEKKHIRLDVVLSFEIEPHEGLEILHTELKEAFPEYSFLLTPDVDITDV